MTFVEKYKSTESWKEKALIINIFHTVAIKTHANWTLRKTATVFEVSIGLVSENIRLANAIDAGVGIMNCSTRQEALNKIERRSKIR